MNTNKDFKSIAELDLTPIKTKLMHVQSGEGWSQRRADFVEFEYRRFLVLMKKFPNEQTAPSVDVDSFWHYHILDTMKYAADCEQVFGYFLHHFPYIGLHADADEGEQARAGQRMRELYHATFGTTGQDGMPAPAAWCGAAAATSAVAVKADKLAWCGAQATNAWCGAVTGKAGVAAGGTVAWCGAQASSAWCGATAGQATVTGGGGNVAWCGATTGKPVARAESANTAWCGAQAKTAWCGAQANTAWYGAQDQAADSTQLSRVAA